MDNWFRINYPSPISLLMNLLTHYFGLDWLAMVLSLLALWLLGNKNRWGFVAFTFANVTWIVVGIWLMQSAGIVLGNIIFLFMNVRGYLSWQKPTSDANAL
jgi:hypothetical protein